jgi:hypothetical protein
MSLQHKTCLRQLNRLRGVGCGQMSGCRLLTACPTHRGGARRWWQVGRFSSRPRIVIHFAGVDTTTVGGMVHIAAASRGLRSQSLHHMPKKWLHGLSNFNFYLDLCDLHVPCVWILWICMDMYGLVTRLWTRYLHLWTMWWLWWYLNCLWWLWTDYDDFSASATLPRCWCTKEKQTMVIVRE